MKAHYAFILTETAHVPRYNVRNATLTKPETNNERQPGGRWIKETQAYKIPAHVWHITQQNPTAWVIETMWADEREPGRMMARIERSRNG